MAAKKTSQRNNAPPSNAAPIFGLLLGVAGLLILTFSLGVFFLIRQRQQVALPPVDLVENPPPAPPVVPPIKVDPKPRPVTASETWWPKDSSLPLTVTQLQLAFPPDKALFQKLGSKSDNERWEAYGMLVAKLSEYLRNESAKRPLAHLLIECYAQEPVESNLLKLREWFVLQIPREEKEFASGYSVADTERSYWALDVSLEALTHKATRFDRAKSLSLDLGRAFGFAIDPTLPRAELKGQAEKLLALRSYRNLVPTARKSVEDAFAIRGTLLQKLSPYISPSFREKVDLELAYIAMPRAKNLWPAYSLVLGDCVKSEDLANSMGLLQMFDQADPELAGKMEPVLARKWKVVEDPKLDKDAKVKAIRRILGVPDPTDRLTLFEKLSRETLTGVKAPAHQSMAILQETARLTHASTMACALLQKEIGLGRFDYLIANLPVLDIPEPKTPDKKDLAKKSTDTPMSGDPMPMGKTVVIAKGGPRLFTGQLVPGAFSKTHPVVLNAGRTYEINMISPFDNYLYLQTSRGQQVAADDDSGGGLNARIVYYSPFNDTFRVIASSYGGGRVGPYTISVREVPGGFGGPPPFPGFGPPGFFPGKRPFPPPFGPPGMFPGPGPGPGMQPPATVGKGGTTKEKTPPAAAVDSAVDETDLNNLSINVAKTRVSAMQNISTKLKGDLREKDLTPRQAAKLAKYLVAVTDKTEGEEALTALPPLAKSRNLMIALADNLETDKANQRMTESVVGNLLDQTLNFGKGETWRLACRKLLLQQALELTGSKKSSATDAGDLLRDYYREQAGLFGVPAAELTPLERPSQVMESLIKHVAKKVAVKGDKDQADQIARQLLAVKFVAQDELEHAALLQRVWLKALAMHLAQVAPERAAEMRALQTELIESDLLAVNMLEQLRTGEEKILRLWNLAHDLK